MAKPNEGVARAALSSSRAIQVIGGPGTGKSQAIVQRAAHLLESGTQPSELLVLAATRSAADALRSRVAACGAPGAAEVQVCTPMQFFEQVLSCPEARAFTGRNPRLLADFEERILMEDMKTCGLKTKRLREMLKFFFRQWTELGDEREGFLVEDDEHLVHDSIMRHLRLRNAMLPAELGNLTVKFLRDAPDAPAWCRRAHVLADDYQDYARATQLALDLIAREGLMVCGNVNEQVVTPDPYPYPEGLAEFASTHDGTEAIVLTESLRCPARIAAVGNGLAQAGDMDERALVSVGEAAEAAGSTDSADPAARGELPGDVRFVQWVDPNAEFKGIARYLKHAFAGTAAPAPAAGPDAAPAAPLHPRDVAVVVPNALWGRSIAKVLEVNGMPSDQLVGYHALKGDPRDERRCADLRAYTLLTLAADPDDAVAWRSWCGFGDYLTHSNHWCRLEDFAEQTGMGVVEALGGLSDFAEPPFVGADVLAARWREAQALLAPVRGKRGFALLAVCKQPGCDTLPPSFEELL
ncbi:MAG: AAA family ATPase, partial [Coriobacteriia bacterium]|nr:AAA family ATPase [Coriobacteriia bacterium]